MLMECILISSSFCQAVKANPAKPVLGRKQNAVAAVLKDCPVATLMAADLAAKTMDYRQTERDFLLGGFREHDVMLRPMLGHPAAMYAYDAAYATGAAWLGARCAGHALASCANSGGCRRPTASSKMYLAIFTRGVTTLAEIRLHVDVQSP